MTRLERLRIQVLAAIATLESARDELDTIEHELLAAHECEHPEDDRQDLSTFGDVRFRCRRCGVTVTNGREEEVTHGGS